MSQTLASPPLSRPTLLPDGDPPRGGYADEDPLDPIDRRLNDDNALEYVDGQFIEKNVSEQSSFVGTMSASRLNVAADFGRLARVYGSDLSYRVWPDEPRRIRRPDCTVIRVERLAGLDADPGEMTIPPDLCIEVISPGDTATEVNRKVEEYRRAGFGLLWVIDPLSRFVDVYAGGTIRRLYENDELALPELLPAFRHAVADLLGPG